MDTLNRPRITLSDAKLIDLMPQKFSGDMVLSVELTNTQAIELYEAGWDVRLYPGGHAIVRWIDGRRFVTTEPTLYLRVKIKDQALAYVDKHYIHRAVTEDLPVELNLVGYEWEVTKDYKGIAAYLVSVPNFGRKDDR